MVEQHQDKAYARLNTAIMATIVVLCAVAFGFSRIGEAHFGLSWYFFAAQDVFVLCLTLVCLTVLKPAQRASHRAPALRRYAQSRFAVPILALALFAFCWFGHYLIFQGYDLSRDEQMANFDAAIFRQGRLFWPFPAALVPYADALNQSFILPIGNHEAWVSTYLPVHAAMRAAMGMIVDAAATGPLLVAIGALALWRIAVRLWPDALAPRLVTMLLYLGSSQVVLTAMTAYAMTAHLALNLVWLALFLRDRPGAHLGAIGIGFLATGLHQPIFHPLFVLPFMLVLLSQRRWRLLLAYGVSYGLICAFWLAWPIWISSHGIAAVPTHGDTAVSYAGRVAILLGNAQWSGLWIMTLNLLRFIAWQHIFLLPLLILGIATARRSGSIAQALALGFLLPVIVMLILLPYQGHGWGYRYLHGVIGNACLLSAYGWQTAVDRGWKLHTAFTWATTLSVALLLPAHLFMAYRMVASYAAVDRDIVASGASVALIAAGSAPFAQDIVLNRADLSNRPLRFDSTALSQAQMVTLCRRGSVLLIGPQQLAPIRATFGMSEDISRPMASFPAACRPFVIQKR